MSHDVVWFAEAVKSGASPNDFEFSIDGETWYSYGYLSCYLNTIANITFRQKKSVIVVVNEFVVPAPCKHPPDIQNTYYIPDIFAPDLVTSYNWYNNHIDMLYLERGLVHLAKNDAIAHAKALIFVDPCYCVDQFK